MLQHFLLLTLAFGKVVPPCLRVLSQGFAAENYEASSGSMQLMGLEHRSAVWPWPPGTLKMSKGPDAALIERSPEMRHREHQLFPKLKDGNKGEYGRGCVCVCVCVRTTDKCLTTFSSSSVQCDTWGGVLFL